ncbi:MAG: BglII/BstYI family type II restriction endonuclease, partial [Vitreimonas sp.]
MVTTHLIPEDIAELYEVHEWRNAAGVLATSCPDEWAQLHEGLRAFRLMRSEVIAPGRNLSKIVIRFEKSFKDMGWREQLFHTAIKVDDVETPSPTHKVDCFKGRVALEMEWN